MATDVTMPRLSDSMEEGTVLKWLVEEGGEVKRGEALVEIETDKANMTYEADTDGTLIEIVAKEGDTLAIGETIARIGDASEAGGSGGGAERSRRRRRRRGRRRRRCEARGRTAKAKRRRGRSGRRGRRRTDEAETEERQPVAAEGKSEAEASGGNGGGEAQGGTATKERAPSGNGGRVKASPVARRMARELGVELARLEGSGPGGRIVKADVQAAAESGAEGGASSAAPSAAPAGDGEATDGAAGDGDGAQADEKAADGGKAPQRGEAGVKGETQVQELTRLQQTVSRRMAESKATAPEFSLSLTVDMTKAVELRTRLKEVADPAPSYNDMVVKAAATALGEHPRVNAAYRDGKFELYERVNIGVAVAAQDALVVPTVFDADRKSLGQISRDARAVAEKVRDKTVTPPELSGATFTVSNLGMYGIEQFTAIINPPQSAILTVGALSKRPAVDETGRIVARDQMQLSLVCDHRILYGADGAKFLARVKELLEQPLSLAL